MFTNLDSRFGETVSPEYLQGLNKVEYGRQCLDKTNSEKIADGSFGIIDATLYGQLKDLYDRNIGDADTKKQSANLESNCKSSGGTFSATVDSTINCPDSDQKTLILSCQY